MYKLFIIGLGKRGLVHAEVLSARNDVTIIGGNLAVPEGELVIPLANKLQRYFDLIIATQDWHPQDHMSFAINHPNHHIGEVMMIDDRTQVLWPVHCVQYSKGAEFHPQLETNKINKIFHKGVNKNIDSYSAFFDNAHLRATGLGDYLRDQKVQDIYLMGLATDYCVKFSSLDAVKLGFSVYVIEDACRGVGLNPGDVGLALEEMRAAGIKLIQSKDILNGRAA